MDPREASGEAGAPPGSSRKAWLSRVFPRLAEPLLSEAAGRLHRLDGVAGQVLIWRGEAADSFYIITSGEVSVKREEQATSEAPLATLGPGQFFGEMGMLTGAPRAATVTARTDVQLLALDRDGFRTLIEGAGQMVESGDRDPAGAAASTPSALSDDWRGTWEKAIRSACGALLAAHDAVRSIDLVGSVRARGDSVELLQLTDLARRIATEYGLEVQVSYQSERPILHISMGALA